MGITKEQLEAFKKKQLEDLGEDAILVYNNITREKQTYKSFLDAYGEPWASIYLKSAKRILKEGFSQEARVSREVGRVFWNKFKNGASADPKGLPILKEHPDDFLIPGRLVTDCNLYARIKHCMPLYLLLLKDKVVKPFEDDHLDVYNKYYRKGIIAVGIPREELGKLLCVTERGVTKQVKYLMDNRIIERTTTNKSEDKYSHSVYVLGNHNGEGSATWVYDDTYKSKI